MNIVIVPNLFKQIVCVRVNVPDSSGSHTTDQSEIVAWRIENRDDYAFCLSPVCVFGTDVDGADLGGEPAWFLLNLDTGECWDDSSRWGSLALATAEFCERLKKVHLRHAARGAS